MLLQKGENSPTSLGLHSPLTTAWRDLLESSHTKGHFGRTPVNALSVTIANTSNRSFIYTVCYLITIAFPPLHLVLLAPALFHVKSANPGGTGKTPLLLALEEDHLRVAKMLLQKGENSPTSLGLHSPLTTAWRDLLESSHTKGHFGRTPVNALSVTIANTSNRSFTYTVCYLITIAFLPLHLVLLAPALFHV